MSKYALPRYTPSGGLKVITIALFLGAILAGALVAWPYQALVRWIPFIYVNVLILIGFGAVLAGGGFLAVSVGHCRNRALALVLALPLAGVPLFASYAWDYEHVLGAVAEINPGVPRADLKREIPFKGYLALKKRVGWKLKSLPVTGAAVISVWIVEALALFAFTLFSAHAAVSRPYCERCGAWCAEKGYAVLGANAQALDGVLQAGDLGAAAEIDAPEGAGADAGTNLTFTVSFCPACQQTGFLSIQEMQIVVKKGKAEEKAIDLVRHAAMQPQQLARALARAQSVEGQKLPAG